MFFEGQFLFHSLSSLTVQLGCSVKFAFYVTVGFVFTLLLGVKKGMTV